MKMLQNLVKVFLVVLLIVISINFSGCKKTRELVFEEPQSKVEQVDQFLNELKKLREDPEKSKEYLEIIDKLAVLVKEEVKRNPERMESFLENMIEIAVKAGPGLALQVEDYANAELKKEMERLKKERSSQLIELRKKAVQSEQEADELIELQDEIIQKQDEIIQKQDEIIQN